ncbi:ABC transporter ATP-binding protein [Arthrobacter sp. Edens01]|uniref:ABC transporter ATP-binding protein n=1 Tax=Arthrobacter sp. Edens01 TaxID=1732020 RepID=UPI0009E7F6F2|nr:ABC transporter ATP-binding protein [Arthrobacter sp. Edens01]
MTAHTTALPDTKATNVSIQSVTKRFHRAGKTIQALAETSLDFETGKFVSLIGPSGCGKSTLLKIMAGLEPATTGRVVIDGKVLRGPQDGVSVAFQKPTLLPWRNVMDNLLLPIQISGKRIDSDIQERAKQLLTVMGLEDFSSHYPRELSGGMEQRAAIARSLISRPSLLLMDEPFGALDEFTREDLNDELLSLWAREPKTLVFVTHSISEAVYLSDQIVVMKARPGVVHEVIDVPLARPRHRKIRNSQEFYDLIRTVRISLEEAKSGNNAEQKRKAL